MINWHKSLSLYCPTFYDKLAQVTVIILPYVLWQTGARYCDYTALRVMINWHKLLLLYCPTFYTRMTNTSVITILYSFCLTGTNWRGCDTLRFMPDWLWYPTLYALLAQTAMITILYVLCLTATNCHDLIESLRFMLDCHKLPRTWFSTSCIKFIIREGAIRCSVMNF